FCLPGGCMSALRRLRFAFVLTIPLIAVSIAKAYTQGSVPDINDPKFPYQMVRNWGTMPAGRTWGRVGSIAMDLDGKSLWVAERCGSDACGGSNLPVVLKFDSSGKLLKSFGAGMFLYPHGMYVDREGNVWLTDGRGAKPEELQKFPDTKNKGHIVVKFSPE